MAESDELQLISTPLNTEPLLSCAVAASRMLSPTWSEGEEGLTVTVATAGGGVGIDGLWLEHPSTHQPAPRNNRRIA
jgi:hypothetical protein